MSTTIEADHTVRRCVRISVRAGLILCAAGALMLGTAEQAIGQENVSERPTSALALDLSGGVQRITIPLYGSVTIETAVEITRADVIAAHIADVQVLSPKRLLVSARAYGTTSIVLLRADEQQSVVEVSVELDLGRLNDAIRTIDPPATARAQSVLGNIVLSGTVSSAERATRIADLATLFLPPLTTGGEHASVQNHLDVAGEQQVLLRCVVAEVNRTASRELGINGYLIGENFRDAFLVNQLGGINPINIGAAGSSLVTQDVPFFTDENGLILREASTISLGFPRVQMQLFIRALAENSLLKILAEPNLVAISGETATFLAGGEFPIPVPQGNQQVTIEWREFGVRLNFTPVVRGLQQVRLRVAPEVSELDYSTAVQIEGFVVPGLRSRASETTVELGNGETIAIAGLLSEEVRGFASRVPGIGDLPVLGALFRSVQFQRRLSELVILVTPEIVAPMDAHQVAHLPGENLKDPNDMQLYLLGLLDGTDESDAEETSGALDDTAVASFPHVPTAPEQLSVHGPWGYATLTGGY
jgi:pilus assembly protein CpaC